MLATFPDAEIYAQGSYSTDTMVKPLTSAQGGGKAGEYDIDIVVERPTWAGAIDALNKVADVVEDDGIYGRMTIDRSKNSCVRIEYAADGNGVGFHIDLVPTKNTEGFRSVPDRESDEWKPSDAKRFADWFNEQAEQNQGIRQIALIIKRLRDLNGLTDSIKSILVLTLVVNGYYANDTIMGDLLSVLDGIITKLPDDTAAPLIANPVNVGENLGESLDDYNIVRAFFVDIKAEISVAVAEDDADTLCKIFGPGFTYTTTEKTGDNVASAVTVQPTRAYGVTDDTTYDR